MGCYFHGSETGHLDDEFPKYFIWINNFLVKAVKFTWSNSLGKVGFFYLREIKILKVTYM